MPNIVNWAASAVSRGTVATTELNSLANAAYATGAAYDNRTNLDQYGCVEVYLASLNPGVGGYVGVFMLQAPDGTNYEDIPVVTTNPAYHQQVATMSVLDTTAAHRIISPWFRLPPNLVKFTLLNGSGIALASSGNTMTLYTANDEVQ